MSKMFVHYSGTVAAFKAASDTEGNLLSKKYENHIVFIKGGDKGAGAIYTHGKYFADADALKYFSKVSDGTTVAEAAGPNGTLTFTANDPALLAVDATAKGITISLSDAFVNKVNNTASALGAASDAANSSGSAYARIAQLQADIQSLTGGNGSISEQINNAINTLDVDAVAGDYVASISQADGKIVPVMGNFAFDAEGAADAALAEAKSYVDGKVDGKFDASGAAADALQDAKDYADGKDSAMDARVKVLEGIDHAQIAADAVAAVLDDAPEAFDTLKEVAEWIANNDHASDVASLVTDVADLKAIDHEAYKAADEANLAAAKKYASDEIAKLSFDAAGTAASEAASALASAKSYVDGKVDGKFDAAGSASAAEAAAKSYADSLAGNYATAAQGAKADAAAPQATTYTKDEVDAMWAWEEL